MFNCQNRRICTFHVIISIIISYLTYAAPAWWGYTDACSRLRLQAVVNRLRRFGLLPPEFPTHEELCEHYNDSESVIQLFFGSITTYQAYHSIIIPENEVEEPTIIIEGGVS